MQTTTLRGVFPEPKLTYRRNFIRENVKSIKQMQGLLQEAGVMQPKNTTKCDKFRNVPSLVRSGDSLSTPFAERTTSQESKIRPRAPLAQKRNTANTVTMGTNAGKPKYEKKGAGVAAMEQNEKFTHRSMQTERTDDLNKLYETGVIKYPSPNVVRPRGSPIKPWPDGDSNCNSLEGDMQNLDMEEKDYIRENMSNIKSRQAKPPINKVPAQAPPTYQRGVVPKYLRERKEEDIKDEAAEGEPCPVGHVLLPEEERKETLRVLRQSYADRIQELNSLPVRSDTLRIKKRKMEIEEELKRIDGGIKVFQRPKVYVKINA